MAVSRSPRSPRRRGRASTASSPRSSPRPRPAPRRPSTNGRLTQQRADELIARLTERAQALVQRVPAEGLEAQTASGRGQPGRGAERIDLVGALPGEVGRVGAAEVAVRRGLPVDRPPQVEIADDRARAAGRSAPTRAPRSARSRARRPRCRTCRRARSSGARRRSRTRPAPGSGRPGPAATTFFAT